MGLSRTIRSWWWCGGCAVVVGCAMVPVVSAKTSQRHVELTPWEQAEHGREALEAIPERSRTKADYTRAMDGFRAVYHDAPGDQHAPDSVNAVAELLTEQGRELHDAKSLKAAVGQYEFLRVQYPGSSLRVAAVLSQAQIYENDLHDAASARERYELLVEKYPRSELAEEAKAGLASLDRSNGDRRRWRRAEMLRGAGGLRRRRRTVKVREQLLCRRCRLRGMKLRILRLRVRSELRR